VSTILPAPAGDRIEMLDALRGFALFGVIVINMSVDTVWSDDVVSRTVGVTDDMVAGVLRTLGAGRFLTIFSFLFGVGVFMQLQRCEERGLWHVPLLLRRLFVLLVIGSGPTSFMPMRCSVSCCWSFIDSARGRSC
jgi:uncharacterized protein